jgi:hypothetical protein
MCGVSFYLLLVKNRTYFYNTNSRRNKERWMLNFFQDLKQKLESSLETAGQKSQRMLEMSRLTIKIKGKKEDVERMAQKLGMEVYKSWEPEQILEVTDHIQETLRAMHDLTEQLKALEKELEELKNSNITARETAEKVSIFVEDTPVLNQTIAKTKQDQPVVQSKEMISLTQTKMPLVASVIYICPFCAHQVAQEASSCSNCRRAFY